MSKKSEPIVKLLSYVDDQPREGKGMLIPRKKSTRTKHTFTPVSAQTVVRPIGQAAAVMAAVFAVLIIGTASFGLVSKWSQTAAPIVTIVDPYNDTTTTLQYGPQPTLSQEPLFVDTRDSFIEESLTFIEVDLATKQLHLFKKGVLYQSAAVEGVAEVGSWWDTPSGLYKVEGKNEEEFTNIGQAYLPWEITFGGNFVIHGWPRYPDETPVGDDFTGGGIRLTDEAARELYQDVAIGTPVLVHGVEKQTRDVFVYEPQVPELDTPHYFIADLDNGTVLAATDLNDEVPIASLTKLMTAVVAAEELDLDGRVRITSPTFVTSLIPRLSGRSSVSMYSLMQLLLVESSNEAAETIAGEMGRDDFLAAMNAKARQLGMLHTHFADPSGLSAENTSSLGDLYRLTKYIYENRRFIFEITANKQVPNAYVGGEFSGLVNFNEVKDMDSFIGGKVGETIAAGETSISLHRITLQGESRVLVVILLGSDNRTADVKTLIKYVEDRFGR